MLPRLIAGAMVVLVVLIAGRYSLMQVADHTERLHLELVARSIYEYRDKNGRWPTRAEDLQETSLPQTAPHDVAMVRNGGLVVNWPADWDREPAANAERVLAYSRGGPLRFGWVWVCWGDFRMEYMRHERVEELLEDVAKR